MSSEKLSQDQFISELRKLSKNCPPKYSKILEDLISRIQRAQQMEKTSVLNRLRRRDN